MAAGRRVEQIVMSEMPQPGDTVPNSFTAQPNRCFRLMGMSTPIGPTVIIRTGPTSPDTPVQVCLLICGDGQPSPS